MYDTKNLIYLFTMLECCEKAWIYTKEFSNLNDFIWANEQKELNATISLQLKYHTMKRFYES